MTTSVTVKTCSWPVHVRTFPLQNRVPLEGGAWSAPTEIPPFTERTFHIHDGLDIMVRELPLPAA
jgi:hypothetical protein